MPGPPYLGQGSTMATPLFTVLRPDQRIIEDEGIHQRETRVRTTVCNPRRSETGVQRKQSITSILRHVISEHVGPLRCDIATLGGIRGRAAQIFLRGPQVKETRRVDSQTRPTSPDISHLRKRRNTISKLSENGTRTKQTQGSIFRWIENKSVSTIVPPISRSLSAVIHFHRRHSAQLTG